MFADIDKCASAPCQNGGICKDLRNGYSCDCSQGYKGVNCQIGKLREGGRECLSLRAYRARTVVSNN